MPHKSPSHFNTHKRKHYIGTVTDCVFMCLMRKSTVYARRISTELMKKAYSTPERRYNVTRLQRAYWHGEDRTRRALAHSDDPSQVGSRDVCICVYM